MPQLDRHGEWQEPADEYPYGDALDYDCPGMVYWGAPVLCRKRPRGLRVHLPFLCEGGSVSVKRATRALTRTGIKCEVRVSRATGNAYLWVLDPCETSRARRVLRSLGVFWA